MEIVLINQIPILLLKQGDVNAKVSGKVRLDSIEEVSRMERLFTKMNQVNTLVDAYPPNITRVSSGNSDNSKEDKVKLFDVVYACIEQAG